jgi:hypothetical protein
LDIGGHLRAIRDRYLKLELFTTTVVVVTAMCVYLATKSFAAMTAAGMLADNFAFYGGAGIRAVYERYRQDRGTVMTPRRAVRIGWQASFALLRVHIIPEFVDVPVRAVTTAGGSWVGDILALRIIPTINQALNAFFGVNLAPWLANILVVCSIGFGFILGRLIADSVFYPLSHVCDRITLRSGTYLRQRLRRGSGKHRDSSRNHRRDHHSTHAR